MGFFFLELLDDCDEESNNDDALASLDDADRNWAAFPTASIWATSKGGRSGWEQLIIWAIVAIAVLTACLAIFVSVRVLCKVKRIKTRVREAEINGKSMSADLKSRVIDVETDIENMRSKR